MTAKQLALQERRALKSKQNQAKGLLPPPQGSVLMSEYLKLSDELDTWRNRAFDAEARLCRSGDVLGEGRLDLLKGPSNANNRS
jgi:hypothetical protein